MGLLHFGIQFHSYDKDGRYVVTVTASNHVGNDSTSLTVSIGGEATGQYQLAGTCLVNIVFCLPPDLAPGVLSITVNGDLSSAGNSLTFNLTQEKVNVIVLYMGIAQTYFHCCVRLLSFPLY